MHGHKTSLYQTPSGTTGLFFQDAHQHHQALTAINAVYQSWAYLPVHTPLIDYSHPYKELLGNIDQQRIHHLIGRDGAVLTLRWDITLFLIKQIHSLLPSSPMPLRLHYADAVVRHQEADDINRNEFFQTGAELLGVPGIEGELETLLLLAECLAELGLKASLHIGSRSLFNAVFASLPKELLPVLEQAITMRRHDTLAQVLAGHFEAPAIALVQKLFQCISAPADLATDIPPLLSSLPGPAARELEHLHRIVAQLHQLRPELDVRLDPSESGSQNYHSGIVFQAYLDGIDSAIASGGRYDTLLERLGCAVPAVGFSLMLSKCLPKIQLASNPHIESIQAQGADFSARYAHACTLRASGKRVSL